MVGTNLHRRGRSGVSVRRAEESAFRTRPERGERELVVTHVLCTGFTGSFDDVT